MRIRYQHQHGPVPLCQFWLAFLALVLAPTGATADSITVEIVPSIGPVVASSSFATYRTNAISGLETNAAGGSDLMGSPADYVPASMILTPQLTTTSGSSSAFFSWNGVANPPSPFSTEFGTALYFGLRIIGGPSFFDISHISFTVTSADPGDLFALSDNNLFDTSGYNLSRVGIVDGANGSQSIVNSGAANQSVNDFYYVGVGVSLDATVFPGTSQDMLGGTIAELNSFAPFDIVGTYTLYGTNGNVLGSGSDQVQVIATPEPKSGYLALVMLPILIAIFSYHKHCLGRSLPASDYTL